MNRTIKVNFVIDRALWKKFQAVCKAKDQAAAQEIRRLIRGSIPDPQGRAKTP